MRKYIGFILIIISILSCRDTNLVVQETDYFSFKRPAQFEIDTITYSKELSNVTAAQKAIGNSEYIEAHIEGEFVINGVNIYFTVKNPQTNDIVPCSCSDYSEEYLKLNGEIIILSKHEYRIVEGENIDTGTRWIELCLDMKHQFFAKEIDNEKFDMIKDLLKTIKMKP